MAGTLTLLYNRSTRGLQGRLADLQYQYIAEVVSSLHVHLTEDRMLEVLLVQGQAARLQAIRDEMLAQRGVITIPQSVRESYGMKPGDTFTLLDLGGVLVLSPRRSEIDAIADRIAREWSDTEETLETMLTALREERDRRG